ncbi:MAG: type II secretion system protein [Parcubacteria group bacterium]|nr:type II secretion system protein [Parcubacteria group bacterium]
MHKKTKGFTLVELLVVVSIIGLLSTLAVVALGSARVKARDVRRANDVRQIMNALELYYNENGKYPIESTAKTLGTVGKCLDSTGFKTAGCTNPFMLVIPRDPSLRDADAPCTVSSVSVCDYSYQSGDGSDFTLLFYLESSVANLSAGIRTAKPDGVL